MCLPPVELLSDENLKFATALRLPIFEWHCKILIRPLALAIENARIIKVGTCIPAQQKCKRGRRVAGSRNIVTPSTNPLI